MGESTAIAWTDHTFNPWWGCARVSPGCLHCYAEAFAKRTGHDVWGTNSDRRFFGDKHWAEPLRWDASAARAGRPALVFCASMADVFEDHPGVVDARARLWELIDRTPNLIWQLLTKRPENIRKFAPHAWYLWPPDNVWIGTTAEDQQRFNERIDYLSEAPAEVLFLSCEPLLGPIEFGQTIEWFDWVIIGGESGPRHRPLNLADARRIVAQCERANVPVFFKQVGGRTPTAGGNQLDGRSIQQFPKLARRVDDVKVDIDSRTIRLHGR